MVKTKFIVAGVLICITSLYVIMSFNQRSIMGYSEIGKSSDGLTPVMKNDKWGYIGLNKKELIPPIYDKATEFKSGYAFVQQNGMWEAINSKGEKRSNSFTSLVLTPDGTRYVGESNNKFYLVDKVGTVLKSYDFDSFKGFNSKIGIGVNTRSKSYTLIDEHGADIKQFIADNVTDFKNGIAQVSMNGKEGLINSSGELIDFDISQITDAKYPTLVSAKDVSTGKWGYTDTIGNWIITPEWDYAGRFCDGLALVMLNNKIRFINTNDKIVIDNIDYDMDKESYVDNFSTPSGESYTRAINWQNDSYDYLHFSDGLAKVKKNGKWGYINLKGTIVIGITLDTAKDYKKGMPIEGNRHDNVKDFYFIDKGKVVSKVTIPCISKYSDDTQYISNLKLFVTRRWNYKGKVY